MPSRKTRTPSEERDKRRSLARAKTAAKSRQRAALEAGEPLDREESVRRNKVLKAGIALSDWEKFLAVFKADYERRRSQSPK
jgi:hypothetical protein